MSEIINNRQQRIEVMKTMMRQLHSGVAEDRVKAQLETALDEAEYSDVFQMEVQLVHEGIPAESIQELCDTHTRVLKKHLDLQVTPETDPGHPVHTMIEENRALTRTTQRIRLLMKQLEELPDEADATPQMRDIQRWLNDLMDVDKHYRRKEYLLFPYFEKNHVPGPATVMWGKHDQARSLLRETIQGLQEITALSAGEAKAYNQFTVSACVNAIDEMVFKEEKIFLPTALDLLSENDWYDIYQQSGEYGYCLYAPQFEWAPAGGAPVTKRPTQDGRVQMPTGSLTVDELIGMFQTMPFDVTFVDKDDTVRYFSPGKDRVFDRSRAVLGRKVQYCHPPKSVRTVNRILQDLKEGKQDRARFWINMRGRLVYICYYAVRGQDGSYLGTLEVTQDLTEVRQLEGERRLLTCDPAIKD